MRHRRRPQPPKPRSACLRGRVWGTLRWSARGQARKTDGRAPVPQRALEGAMRSRCYPIMKPVPSTQEYLVSCREIVARIRSRKSRCGGLCGELGFAIVVIPLTFPDGLTSRTERTKWPFSWTAASGMDVRNTFGRLAPERRSGERRFVGTERLERGFWTNSGRRGRRFSSTSAT